MRPRRILIVDDDASARDALCELLCGEGYEVAIAANGADGLALIDSFHPDVLLTDVEMPAMSGRELAEASRGRPSPPRVVFMSGRSEANDGDATWLSKPVDVDVLFDTIDRLVESRT